MARNCKDTFATKRRQSVFTQPQGVISQENINIDIYTFYQMNDAVVSLVKSPCCKALSWELNAPPPQWIWGIHSWLDPVCPLHMKYSVSQIWLDISLLSSITRLSMLHLGTQVCHLKHLEHTMYFSNNTDILWPRCDLTFSFDIFKTHKHKSSCWKKNHPSHFILAHEVVVLLCDI